MDFFLAALNLVVSATTFVLSLKFVRLARQHGEVPRAVELSAYGSLGLGIVLTLFGANTSGYPYFVYPGTVLIVVAGVFLWRGYAAIRRAELPPSAPQVDRD